MKQVLRKFNISITGDFGAARPHEKIRGWIEAHGGRFSKDFDENVTHLVCSLEDFKKKIPVVKKAMKLKTHIVSYDWLEDCLMQRKKLKAKDYLIRHVAKEQKRATQKMDDGCDMSRKDMLSGNHHIYYDPTDFFPYSVTLVRVDLERNRNERYNLTIWESNALPFLYACSVRYTRPGHSAVEILAPMASYCDEAFAAFRKFFASKTGYKWEARMLIQELPEGEDFFRYTRPVMGKPFGAVPPEIKELMDQTEAEERAREEEERAKEAEEGGGGEENNSPGSGSGSGSSESDSSRSGSGSTDDTGSTGSSSSEQESVSESGSNSQAHTQSDCGKGPE